MLVIFDLDDTLIDTSDLYWKVREEFIDLFKTDIIARESIRDIFESEDSKNMVTMGFSPYRYGVTMNNVVDLLNNQKSLKNSIEIKERIKVISNKILFEIPSLIDGALDVLKILKAKQVELALLTRGSLEVQMRKIWHHKLDKYFKKIKVVAKKDDHEFSRIISEMHATRQNSWIIGDSIKSDINPALQINSNAIQVIYKHEHYNWLQEHDAVPINNSFKTASSLLNVLEILPIPLFSESPLRRSRVKPTVQFKLF
jgi:putative hydrolase of the HAD superfamily